jgi:hypothetical protein
MEGASPTTSALELYYYDGENIHSSLLFGGSTIRGILRELDAVKATETNKWSLDDITLPVYGLYITKTDGWGLFSAWSNNYWIAQDGTAYSFKYDFEKIKNNYDWTDEREYPTISFFPCARFLTQDENGWRTTLLKSAVEPDTPNGITMDLVSWDSETVSVNITNNNDAEWMYGEEYVLQVLLDGIWYEIPALPGHWVFNSIGLIVQSGEVQEKTYNLEMYGELPAGTYRLVAFGLSVENTIV